MSNEIAQMGQRRLAEAQPATNEVAALPTAVEQVMAGLKEAIGSMEADDLVVELSAHQEGHRTSARFSLRAYRREKKVLDEERNV
jgi:hypothetical protein